MPVSEHEVIIVGGGPTGLMLAGELALAGVNVGVLERRPNQEVEGSRAGGLHPRTIEMLDQRGIADRFIAQGQKHPFVSFPGARLVIGDLPTRHNYLLALWQAKIESSLADWVSGLDVTIHRGCTAVDFAQSEIGIEVELEDGRSFRAKYLVGCDGGRSLVRRRAGIAFPGWEPSVSYLIAEAETADEPVWGARHGEKGICAIAKLEGGRRVRIVLSEPELRRGGVPTLDELRTALITAYGADFGVCNVTWLSRFTDMARQAAVYRVGRILLAGDAAHVHSPAGGQGLNIGIQDAVNLGWKLARVVRGVSSEKLLDTYEAERHPVGARILKNTLAITALNRGDERTTALRDIMSGVMQMDEPRKCYAAMLSGLDICYDLGDGHPLVGRRMPDLDLTTADGPQHAFTFLHDAQPVLLNFGERGSFTSMPWTDRIKIIDASYDGIWEIPVLGSVDAPGALLIRPDGYVAWAGGQTGNGLAAAVAAWH